jgi:hypothetical protein
MESVTVNSAGRLLLLLLLSLLLRAAHAVGSLALAGRHSSRGVRAVRLLQLAVWPFGAQQPAAQAHTTCSADGFIHLATRLRPDRLLQLLLLLLEGRRRCGCQAACIAATARTGIMRRLRIIAAVIRVAIMVIRGAAVAVIPAVIAVDTSSRWRIRCVHGVSSRLLAATSTSSGCLSRCSANARCMVADGGCR